VDSEIGQLKAEKEMAIGTENRVIKDAKEWGEILKLMKTRKDMVINS
jgi:hypothetical protein